MLVVKQTKQVSKLGKKWPPEPEKEEEDVVEEEKAPEEPPPEEEAVVTIFGKLKRTKVTKVSNCTCSSCFS